jgi:hypothetical protein
MESAEGQTIQNIRSERKAILRGDQRGLLEEVTFGRF